MDDARRSAGQGGGVPASRQPVAAGVAADQPDLLVAEGVERPDRVGATAHARDHRVRQPTDPGADLCSGLDADHPLKIAYHDRERVRAHHRSDAVVRGVDGAHPVPECLVDRVLQGPAADRHRYDLRSEHPHPGHVQCLAVGVLLAHVDHAVQAEQRGGRRGCYAVLAGPVSAITLVLPIRWVSSAWPRTLLILCEPVWAMSSRLRNTACGCRVAEVGILARE